LQVEGTSDEALKVKRNSRRKKASFSKSGDEEIPTSSGGENKPDLLAVSCNDLSEHAFEFYNCRFSDLLDLKRLLVAIVEH
jgi:hypothetical protein